MLRSLLLTWYPFYLQFIVPFFFVGLFVFQQTKVLGWVMKIYGRGNYFKKGGGKGSIRFCVIILICLIFH
jgi:hypothetical protein